MKLWEYGKLWIESLDLPKNNDYYMVVRKNEAIITAVGLDGFPEERIVYSRRKIKLKETLGQNHPIAQIYNVKESVK